MSAHKDYFALGIAYSAALHIGLGIFFYAGGAFDLSEFKQPVIYSVTIEGGKTLGGMSQVPKDDKKAPIAPPKNVQEAPAAPKTEPVKKEEVAKDEKKEEEKAKEVEDAEVSLQEKKEKEEEEKKKKEAEVKKADEEKKAREKKAKDEEVKKKEAQAKAVADAKKAKEQGAAAVNKNYQAAIQRYLGESSDAGGKGFGAARIGGSGMGGGQVRPPEFFIYKKVLEEHIKAGWRWHNTSMALVTQVIIDIEADGRIRNVTLAQSSGNSEFDESVVRAIQKSSPVPRPPTTVYQWFRSVRMTFDPRD